MGIQQRSAMASAPNAETCRRIWDDIEFAQIDTDGDGVLSREEWVAKYGNDDGFAALDLDGDGQIDANEFSKRPGGAGGPPKQFPKSPWIWNAGHRKGGRPGKPYRSKKFAPPTSAYISDSMLEERWHQYQEQHGEALAAAGKNTDTAAGSNKMQASDSKASAAADLELAKINALSGVQAQNDIIEQMHQESLEGAGEYTESTLDFQTRIATRPPAIPPHVRPAYPPRNTVSLASDKGGRWGAMWADKANASFFGDPRCGDTNNYSTSCSNFSGDTRDPIRLMSGDLETRVGPYDHVYGTKSAAQLIKATRNQNRPH